MDARPSPMDPAWSMALEASCGSVERWRHGFVADIEARVAGIDSAAVYARDRHALDAPPGRSP